MVWPMLALPLSSATAAALHFDGLAHVASLELQIDALDLIDVERHVGAERRS